MKLRELQTAVLKEFCSDNRRKIKSADVILSVPKPNRCLYGPLQRKTVKLNIISRQ